MKKRRMVSDIVFLDLMMNTLLCFIAFFILALIQMNPAEKTASAIELEGKFIIVIHWPDSSEDDVDLYVMDPVGNIAFFKKQSAGLMHLERDDLGKKNDQVNAQGGEIQINHNEERTVIRAVVPGEYIVNAHMYSKKDMTPTPITVTLNRLIGPDTELVKKELVLERTGDERTVFRFTIRENETVSNINELPRRFVNIINREGDER